jgi:hypothetical protein
MSEDKKHGLYKVVAQADKLARIVMDQLAKDGCGNLENIRDAMLPALVAIEREKEDARRGPWMGYDLARPEAMRREIRKITPTIGGLRALFDERDDKVDAINFAGVPDAPQIEVIQDVADGRRRYCRTYRGAKFWTRHADCWLIKGPCDRDRLETLFNGYVDAARAGMPLTFFINEDWLVTPKGELITGLQLMRGEYEK